MNPLDFINALFPNFNITDCFEDDLSYTLNGTAKEINHQKLEYQNWLASTDRLTLSITIDDEPYSFYSEQSNWDIFSELSEDDYTEDFNIELIINKQNVDHTLRIYDLDCFVKTLTQRGFSAAYTIFQRAFNSGLQLHIQVLGVNDTLQTDTISFTPIEQPFKVNLYFDRLQRIERKNSLSVYNNTSHYDLTPEDFNLTDSYAENYPGLYTLFSTLKLILSITYLFDLAIINQIPMRFQLNGYKTFSWEIDPNNAICNSTQCYYKIYQWVFNGGNLTDKIGLARNIISLNFVNSQKLEIRDETYQSILSSYKVYERQNIKQYIEIRNKISDQLLDFNSRANKIVEGFAGSFQKSALTVVTFYSSTIVIRVLSKGDFTNLFNYNTLILSLSFLILSLIYFFVARWDVQQLKHRFISSYNNLKLRYTDLLDEADISRILNNDKEFNEDINFIAQKVKWYSRMWVAFVLVLMITTITLYFMELTNTMIIKFIGHLIY